MSSVRTALIFSLEAKGLLILYVPYIPVLGNYSEDQLYKSTSIILDISSFLAIRSLIGVPPKVIEK
jgi:hypothetical protein